MCFTITHIKEKFTGMKFNSKRYCMVMFTCLNTCNGSLRTQLHKQKSWSAKFCESGGQATEASAVDWGGGGRGSIIWPLNSPHSTANHC